MKSTLKLLIFVSSMPGLSAQSFDQWLTEQASAVLSRKEVLLNGRGRQGQSPSNIPRSTALVDRASSTDVLSVSANIVPVGPSITVPVALPTLPACIPSDLVRCPATTGFAKDSPVRQATAIPNTASPSKLGSADGSGSGSVTFSLYSLAAALRAKNPVDNLEFYKDHAGARRLSFTLGSSASTQLEDNTDQAATVAGFKLVLLDRRELFTRPNQAETAQVREQLTKAMVEAGGLKNRVKEAIFIALNPTGVDASGVVEKDAFGQFLITAFTEDRFPVTLQAIPAGTMKRIHDLLTNSAERADSLQKAFQDTYDRIHRRAQVALAYTGNLRPGLGNDNHRSSLIVEYGLSNRINWTFNASGDYVDVKDGIDLRGGTGSTEILIDVIRPSSPTRTPVRLALGGQGSWITKLQPQYTAQAMLSIPLGEGVELPLVYRYANRFARINQSSSELRLGFAVDIGRIAQALK